MKTILPRLLAALVAAPPSSERELRVAELSANQMNIRHREWRANAVRNSGFGECPTAIVSAREKVMAQFRGRVAHAQ